MPGNAAPGQPPYGAPGGYGPGTPYGPPPGPPKRGNGLKIGLIIGAVVLLLFCVCGVLVIWGLTQVDTDPETQVAPPPGPTFTTEAEPTPDPGVEQSFVRGDCVVNDGTDSQAELRKVPCGPGTHEVLLKIPFSTDGAECETLAPNADANYVHDSPVNFADFVLCLKKR